MVVALGLGDEGNGKRLVKRYRILVIQVSSYGLSYNAVTVVNNSPLHTGNLLRVDLTCSYHIHKKLHLCEVMDMLIRLIAVVISQCICISRHHFVLINMYNFY